MRTEPIVEKYETMAADLERFAAEAHAEAQRARMAGHSPDWALGCMNGLITAVAMLKGERTLVVADRVTSQVLLCPQCRKPTPNHLLMGDPHSLRLCRDCRP